MLPLCCLKGCAAARRHAFFGEGSREGLPRSGVDRAFFPEFGTDLPFSHFFRSSHIGSGGPFSSRRMTGGFPCM